MNESLEEYFNDFRNEISASSEALHTDSLTQFIEIFQNELSGAGFIEGINFCHYKAPQGGCQVDGYWYDDDENILSIFIADYLQRSTLETFSRKDMSAIFKRLENFLLQSLKKELISKLELTSDEWKLSNLIKTNFFKLCKINLVLLSERKLSERVKDLASDHIDGVPVIYHVWDIVRLYTQTLSKEQREPLDIELDEICGENPGISCLPVNLENNSCESYLVVMPGNLLADLYEKYDSRLLEHNVRTFLQSRGKVNRGIRATIIHEPQNFFVYNNGITATAQSVEVKYAPGGFYITRIIDLQIVNGGQTTASLFHTRRKDRASLDNIYVQMKLSVIGSDKEENIVPKISEYANTQNKVNAAEFFSNSPFNLRMEELSRRIMAPAKEGSPRGTYWFYERARGQYVEAKSKLSKSEQVKFQLLHPKNQLITKEDLGKYENIWSGLPYLVSRGRQKNYAFFVKKIFEEWNKSDIDFNEYYFKCIVAKAILFRETEKIVSSQPWYQTGGSLRSHIVYYSQSSLAEIARNKKREIPFISIWDCQKIPSALTQAIIQSSTFINHIIINPDDNEPRDTEWFKKEQSWNNIKNKLKSLEDRLNDNFYNILVNPDELQSLKYLAAHQQKSDNRIRKQINVVDIPVEKWVLILSELHKAKLLTQKEYDILKIATQIPHRIPTEKQSDILINLYARAKNEGIILE